jgi:ribosome biogenesis GTPase YqeH
MARCKGCGALLQSTDKNAAGYTPKEGSEYCQRCFRLSHYGDLMISMKTGIDPHMVLNRVEAMDAVILWVVDLFDFEAGMIDGISRRLANKPIIMAATKRDLLPETLSDDKSARFVFTRLKDLGIHIDTLILTSRKDREANAEIQRAVKETAQGKPCAVIGKANSGKSTLLNCLAENDQLTISRYPGTTLDFNEVKIGGQVYIDTPGIEIEHSMLMETDEKDLSVFVPQRRIKPAVYQLKGNQTFSLGGLARIDLFGCEKASCVFYLADSLNVHRSKTENADELWQKHYDEMLKPVPLKNEFSVSQKHKDSEKMDIVIDGLGWACVSGKITSVKVHVPKGVNVTYRKAML